MNYTRPNMEIFIVEEENVIVASPGAGSGLTKDEWETDTGNFGDL